jgi:DNA-binding transcriptional LysR family regulator
MAPTAKADRLAEAVRHALHVLDVAIQEGERYDPAASDRTFRLHRSDIGETVFLPRLLQALAGEAPNVRLETFQFDDKDIGPALESGRIDLALGYLPALADVEHQALLSERYVVLMRAPTRSRRAPTRAALAQLRYAVVRRTRDTRALKDLGLRQHPAGDAALPGVAAHPRRDRSRRRHARASRRRFPRDGRLRRLAAARRATGVRRQRALVVALRRRSSARAGCAS